MANMTLASLVAHIPAPAHRWLLRTLQPVRLRLWGLLRRQVEGIVVLGFADDGRLLLVRHSYHMPDQWLLPGGGRAPGEDIFATAQRELAEETGCTLHHASHIGQIVRRMPQGWTNTIVIVAGSIGGIPKADGREIVAIALHPPTALPAQTHAAVHEYLAVLAGSER
jgi:8-oxo-dGTP pyrophosphatase MutT (NUDIX family)